MKKLIVRSMFLVIFCVLFQPALAALPTVTSGTLHTHLSADYGTYRTDMATPATNGQGVALWLDQSSNGHNAAQYEAASEPNLVTNVVNGKPVLRFDGLDDYIDAYFTSVSLNQPYTVFLALATRDAANEYIYDGIDSTDRQVMAAGMGSNPGIWYFWAGSDFQTTEVRQTLFQDHTLVIDSNTLEHYIYGELQGSATIGNRKLNTAMRIGCRYGKTMFGDFDLAELIIYAGALDATDCDAVESYLETKYNTDTNPHPNTGAGTLFAKFDGSDVAIDSGKVTSWNDQVGSMDILGADPNKPSLVSVAFPSGTKNVIRFDANDVLKSNSLGTAITGPTTCFVVARRFSDANSGYLLDGLDATNRRALMTDGSPRTVGIYSEHRLSSFTPDVNMWQVYSAIYDSTGPWSQIYVDGMHTGREYAYIGELPFEGLTVGARYTGINVLDGDIAEILVYEGHMDDANRIAVEESLFTKYGIGPACGAAYTTYNDKDFNRDCKVDFMDFADFAEEWLEIVVPGVVPLKDFEDFDYKWEMDYYPWDFANIDLDGNANKDWVQSSSGDFSLAGGILTGITGTSPHLIGHSGYGYTVWPVADINVATGYTTEFKVQIHSDSGSADAFKIQISPVDSYLADIMVIGTNEVKWWISDGSTVTLNTGDNTDDFHTFRVARHVGDPCTTSVWRDNVLIGDSLAVTYSITSSHRFYIGDIDGSVNGGFEMDYLAITGGVWAPIPYNEMDFDRSLDVGFSDLSIFVLEWLNCTTPGDPQCD